MTQQPPEHKLAPLVRSLKPGPGSVFAVHGDLRVLDADVLLVPTDGRGHVTSGWHWAMGLSGPEEAWLDATAVDELRRHSAFLMPSQSTVGDSPPVLAVDVGGSTVENSAVVMGERLAAALVHLDGQVMKVMTRWQGRRSRPLLAMPLIGVRGGNLGDHRGAVIEEVIGILVRYAENPNSRFDVVVVCRDATDYAALQFVRRGLAPDLTGTWAKDLADHASAGTLAVLFGAGVSAATGLPMWSTLLQKLAAHAPVDDLNAEHLSALDAVDAATILTNLLGPDFEKIVAQELHLSRHSLTHALLADIQPSVAITTNFDRGYEMAVEAVEGRVVATMPWEVPRPGQRPLLKLHGDVERRQIVLNRRNFAAMQAFRRPLTGVLQERMLAGHVLAIGTSMSDATLVTAGEEVRGLLAEVRPESLLDHVGTVILTKPDRARSLLLSAAFTVVEGDDDVLNSARDVDILLDWVAMQASKDLSFALDARFADLATGKGTEQLVAALDDAGLAAIREVESTALGARVLEFLRELGWKQ